MYPLRKEFKQDAVNYYYSSGKTTEQVAKELKVGKSTMSKWIRDAKINSGTVPHRGSRNQISDVEKENARLKKEPRNTQDALDIPKKGNKHTDRLTESIYPRIDKTRKKRSISVNSVLKLTGVSKSGYYAYHMRQLSEQHKRKERVKQEITHIYNESKQIYAAPKITEYFTPEVLQSLKKMLEIICVKQV